MELLSTNKCFGGIHQRYKHHSTSLDCEMTFAVFLPPQVLPLNTETPASVPALYWLSGLTCNEENFMQKAGAQRVAAELGVALIAPDTSPRGEGVPDDETGAYDLGLGAGFYVNATQAPWNAHYKMYDYVVHELAHLVEKQFPVNQLKSISGHSMGGHGALSIALKNPQRYRSASAFSPITNPINCPWGEKAFCAYLGDDRDTWKQYDSCELLASSSFSAARPPILVDQGKADDFLTEQLKPEALSAAAAKANYEIQLRLHEGYDHSYHFIASFIEDHLRFHHAHLTGTATTDNP